MKKETKEMLDRIRAACDAIETIEGRPEGMNISINELFVRELRQFFMYLSASDGKIATNERDYMNELFGVNMSVADYVRQIYENNMHSKDYEEKLPLSYKIIALFETRDDDKAEEIKGNYPNLLNSVFDFYREAGIEFISCDRDPDIKEIEDLGLLLAKKRYKLQEFIEKKM